MEYSKKRSEKERLKRIQPKDRKNDGWYSRIFHLSCIYWKLLLYFVLFLWNLLILLCFSCFFAQKNLLFYCKVTHCSHFLSALTWKAFANFSSDIKRPKVVSLWGKLWPLWKLYKDESFQAENCFRKSVEHLFTNLFISEAFPLQWTTYGQFRLLKVLEKRY